MLRIIEGCIRPPFLWLTVLPRSAWPVHEGLYKPHSLLPRGALESLTLHPQAQGLAACRLHPAIQAGTLAKGGPASPRMGVITPSFSSPDP